MRFLCCCVSVWFQMRFIQGMSGLSAGCFFMGDGMVSAGTGRRGT